jgi:hypothetical protein
VHFRDHVSAAIPASEENGEYGAITQSPQRRDIGRAHKSELADVGSPMMISLGEIHGF